MSVKSRLTLASAAVALALDLGSKRLASGRLEPGESREIASFFSLVLVENRGAAFSLFAGSGDSQGLKMTLLAVLALVPLAWFYRAAAPGERWTLVALGSVLGGALGNIHDRLRLGAVTDFLDLHWGDAHWPAFNLADVFVVAGVIWIVLCTLRGAFAGRGEGPGGASGPPAAHARDGPRKRRGRGR